VEISRLTVWFEADKPMIEVLYTLLTHRQLSANAIVAETAGIFAHSRRAGDLQYSLRCLEMQDLAIP
jgi:hypothetical protein